jgi:hypothetical protein
MSTKKNVKQVAEYILQETEEVVKHPQNIDSYREHIKEYMDFLDGYKTTNKKIIQMKIDILLKLNKIKNK